jgi:phenylpropionate dioxygenase-like ring-hydroxylating dioxygenase large terminal subunit
MTTVSSTSPLLDDPAVVQRIFDHIDNRTTDLGETTWREPVENYRCEKRFAAELDLLRRYPTPYCPSAALAEPGSYLARVAAATPLVAVRDGDGTVGVFRNACRHRGTQLADGAGCKNTLVCRYHGWAYGLDGSLRHVPHEHGFPGLDKATHGLARVESTECHGVVFVAQDEPFADDAHLESIPELIPPGYRLLLTDERDIPANWKIIAEGFLEGYHIRSTHAGTFYPLQYDNLNVIESFGRNDRITFPYRAIEKLRNVPPAERSADGRLTYVYHLFPNVMVATFPGRIFMVVLEPLTTDCTRQVLYMLTDQKADDAGAQEALARGAELVDAGGAEDREMVCSIQRSLNSGANDHFEFGRFEGAIAHFHRTLQAAVDRVG